MSRALITEGYLTDIADAIRAKNGSSDTYTPPQMAAAIQAIPTGITPTGTMQITQNGTHDVTQYASANVNVSGGGGSGVILSGTSAPTAAMGNNEDLYVQYTVHQGWNYVYGIDAIYRKVNGEWVSYVDPTDPRLAVHVWTQSTGGNDAAMYVQKASYDPNTGTYTPVGDAVIVIYTSVQGSNTYDLFGMATLGYPSSWKIIASGAITDGTNTYASGATVAIWSYNQNKDIYLRWAE